jgi:hypothetical protein
MSDAAIFQAIGGIVMAVGVIVFLLHKGGGGNSLKVLGVEASFSAPSLMIFLIGAGLFAFPFTSGFHPREKAATPAPVEATTDVGLPDPPEAALTGYHIQLVFCGYSQREKEILATYMRAQLPDETVLEVSDDSSPMSSGINVYNKRSLAVGNFLALVAPGNGSERLPVYLMAEEPDNNRADIILTAASGEGAKRCAPHAR